MAISSKRERLQDQIEELRGEMGDIAQALAEKADLPVDRVRARIDEFKDEFLDRGAQLRDRTAQAAARTREMADQPETRRWTKLMGVVVIMVTLTLLVRRLLAQ